MRIGDREIGCHSEPFIIAEMSGNHNQSLVRALEIVEAAAASGAHALKIQTYTADTMTIDLDEREFHISNKASLWEGESLYRLYQKAHTPWEWHKPILERCRELGLIGFSTPFDATAVDFLEELDTPCYKVASFENTDLPLIRRIARTGKPIILSTGMATLAQLDETVRCARENGCQDLVLLKCTSSYPATPENSDIRTIPSLRENFQCEAGLSDHTLGIGVPLAAIALGASVIEKHFTLDRAEGGVDAAFSLEPGEFRELVRESKNVWQALGQVSYGPTQQELGSLQFRRSLYIVKDLEANEILTADNLRSIRPGLGLEPKYYDMLLGKKVKIAVKRGTPVSWDMIL
ncbi:MAG TPA: pseudaminic acid synthase [Bacillota bacterium]|nr:pseudaminic acid synthase [Bacillota bacterium]